MITIMPTIYIVIDRDGSPVITNGGVNPVCFFVADDARDWIESNGGFGIWAIAEYEFNSCLNPELLDIKPF